MKCAWLVVMLVAACGGAQKSKSSPDDLCPGTEAKVRTACGCRPTEAKFVEVADHEAWSNPEEAANIRKAARTCADGQRGNEIGACVTQAVSLGLASSAVLSAFSSIKGDDATFLACAAKLAP